MRNLRTTRGAFAAVLLTPLFVLPSACSKKPAEEYKPAETAELSKFKVTGKVTHHGKPVTFGYVVFYGQTGIDKESGKSAPPVVTPIGADGTYTIDNPPIGPNAICVATDPDLDVASLYQAGSLNPGMGGPGGPPGGGPEGPPGGPPMPPGGGPPMPPGAGPPGGFPGGGPPMPPMPHGKGPPSMPKSEAAEKLTEDEKKTLKAIHQKYGKFGQSPLIFIVAGESDQAFDIDLK